MENFGCTLSRPASKIAKVVDDVVIRDRKIPLSDHRFVHLINRNERSVRVANDVFVIKMSVRNIEFTCKTHDISSFVDRYRSLFAQNLRGDLGCYSYRQSAHA